MASDNRTVDRSPIPSGRYNDHAAAGGVFQRVLQSATASGRSWSQLQAEIDNLRTCLNRGYDCGCEFIRCGSMGTVGYRREKKGANQEGDVRGDGWRTRAGSRYEDAGHGCRVKACCIVLHRVCNVLRPKKLEARASEIRMGAHHWSVDEPDSRGTSTTG
jgi:hypothetical protein